MGVILKRTLQETLKLSAVIISLAAGLLGGLVLAKAGAVDNVPAFSSYLNYRLIEQHITVFFLICGAMLMVIVSAVGTGLIAGEVHEGTFRILVSKPNSRVSILLGKVLGMLIGSLMLMVMSLSTMYVMNYLCGNYDGNIFIKLLSYFPAYLMYGLIVTLFFSSLAVLLSCVAKKRIIALLPMLLVMIVVLVLPLVVRLVLSLRGGAGLDKLAFVDLNYHFGSMFRWCTEFFGGIKGTSGQLEIPTLLMNMFKQTAIDPDIAHQTNGAVLTTVNDTIPVTVLLGVYGALTLINYAAGFAIIRRKDV
ncbi:MAG: ABC transporter permease subunit [Firmicutes bacterium]|nr:ABC transporter permease subunit [Bacillota bacterium]